MNVQCGNLCNVVVCVVDGELLVVCVMFDLQCVVVFLLYYDELWYVVDVVFVDGWLCVDVVGLVLFELFVECFDQCMCNGCYIGYVWWKVDVVVGE